MAEIAGDREVTRVPILGLKNSRDLKKSASPTDNPIMPLIINKIHCLSEIVSQILKIKIVGIRSNKDISKRRKFTLSEPILLIAFAKKYELTAQSIAVINADISPMNGINYK